MAAKLTRLTHEIVTESCTICSSRSRRKVLDTHSYITECGDSSGDDVQLWCVIKLDELLFLRELDAATVFFIFIYMCYTLILY
jgi:hypothetical protein